MEKVVAKFRVSETGQAQYGQDSVQHTVKMNPVMGYGLPEDSENHKFWKATPVGEFKMGALNAEVGEYFDVGAEYYITIEKA